MASVSRFWNDVWPTLLSMGVFGVPSFAWQHWRISVRLSRHFVQVTGTLDKKLKVKVEVDSAGAVTVAPVPPEQAEPQ